MKPVPQVACAACGHDAWPEPGVVAMLGGFKGLVAPADVPASRCRHCERMNAMTLAEDGRVVTKMVHHG